MKLKVTLKEDHIKLIKALWFQDFNTKVGVDKFQLYGGNFLYEDMSRILGLEEHMIPETYEDWDGPKYDDGAMDKMNELADYLGENILYIEEILHQKCTEGIKVGTYTRLDHKPLWEYVGE